MEMSNWTLIASIFKNTSFPVYPHPNPDDQLKQMVVVGRGNSLVICQLMSRQTSSSLQQIAIIIIITIVTIIVIVIVIIIINRMMPGMCTRPLMVAHVEAVTTVIMLFSNNPCSQKNTRKTDPLYVHWSSDCRSVAKTLYRHYSTLVRLIRFKRFKTAKCINTKTSNIIAMIIFYRESV